MGQTERETVVEDEAEAVQHRPAQTKLVHSSLSWFAPDFGGNSTCTGAETQSDDSRSSESG